MQISKNIPLPAHSKRRGESRRLLEAMKAGDSVFLDPETCNRFNAAANQLGIKITRKSEEGGFRVWRIS